MGQNYIVDKLSLSDLDEGGKIYIPPFQRGIVWTKEHRKEFLSTIRRGDPFGVILVYKMQDNEGVKYKLIDGLQRLSTIKAYNNKPLDFIDEKDQFINESKLDELITSYYDIQGLKAVKEDVIFKNKKKVKKVFLQIVKDKVKPKCYQIWQQFCNELGWDTSSLELMTKFCEFHDDFFEKLKLPDITIPAIVYIGDEDNLPTVFQQLNTGAVTLTKYEIFSSIWSQNKIIFDDEQINTKVIEKYNKLRENSNFEVDTDEEIIKNRGITLFEYCYALSEIVTDTENNEASILLSKEKKSTDPTGFDLLALICGLQINKSGELYKDEYLGKVGPEFLINLKNYLLESLKFVYKSLEKWIIDLRGNYIKNPSQYQIFYMVVSVFKHKFLIDTSKRILSRREDKESKTWLKNFQRFGYKNYLYDLLSNFWGKNRQVSDLKRCLETEAELNRYTYDVPKESMETALREYLDDSRDKFNSRTIDNVTKLLLNYEYQLLFEEDNNRKKFFDDGYLFDIEHIVPVDKFKKFNLTNSRMSSLGNLCYLPVKDNRSKREKTIYEYAAERPSLVENNDFLEFIDYPKKEELDFINYDKIKFETEFHKYVEEREERIIQQILKLMYSK